MLSPRGQKRKSENEDKEFMLKYKTCILNLWVGKVLSLEGLV